MEELRRSIADESRKVEARDAVSPALNIFIHIFRSEGDRGP
jgi:hypothetical protein